MVSSAYRMTIMSPDALVNAATEPHERQPRLTASRLGRRGMRIGRRVNAHCRQPPSIAARSAVASRIMRTNENGCPLGNRVAGQGSDRKLDAHQGVSGEMAYCLCRLLRRTGSTEAGPYQ